MNLVPEHGRAQTPPDEGGSVHRGNCHALRAGGARRPPHRQVAREESPDWASVRTRGAWLSVRLEPVLPSNPLPSPTAPTDCCHSLRIQPACLPAEAHRTGVLQLLNCTPVKWFYVAVAILLIPLLQECSAFPSGNTHCELWESNNIELG